MFRKLKKMLKWIAFFWCFAGVAVVVGCKSDAPVSEASYPEYNCWWR